jgi:ABC-type multidrug transport system fused ATPase/permease subunit
VTTFARLQLIAAPYRSRIILACGLAALTCLLNLPIPLLVQGLVDRAAAGDGYAALPLYAGALLGVYICQSIIVMSANLTTGRFGLDLGRDLRRRLYARLQRIGLSYYDHTPAGAILYRLTDDVTAVQNLISGQTLTMLIDSGTSLIVLLLLWRQSPIVGLTALALVPVYVACFRRFGRRIRAGADQVRERLDIVFSHLKSKIDGILVVKACGREETEMAEFSARIGAAHRPRVQLERMTSALANLSLAIGGVGTALVFAVGTLEAAAGRLSPGGVVAAAAMAALLFGPLARLADLTSLFHTASASLARLGDILDQEPDVPEPKDPVALPKARGLVEFDQVSFGYHVGQPVLWDIRLPVQPGMRTALVGPTGCGKTTLLNLLQRFYDPTWGEIRLDGVPLQKLASADLRQQIGIVPQEPVIFHGSLADNIKYGAPDADAKTIDRAARAALVHEFLPRLPDGYETIIGESGYKLSQGERQRVAIARAICKDPAIVVLDEATSSLDSSSEMLIQKALTNLLRGRTSFTIAHRLGTVIDADLIVVIEGGEIAQLGKHTELLADRDGLYRRLCRRQFGLVPEASPRKPRVPGMGALQPA